MVTIKTFSDGEVLYANDLNTSFTGIVNEINTKSGFISSVTTTSSTTSNAYVTLHTHSLNNTQANIDRVRISFWGCGYVHKVVDAPSPPANTDVYISTFINTTQKSGYEINVDEGYLHLDFSAGSNGTGTYHITPITGEYIFIAGTDYTKGTAFNIYVKGKTGNNTVGFAKVFKSFVYGFNV